MDSEDFVGCFIIIIAILLTIVIIVHIFVWMFFYLLKRFYCKSIRYDNKMGKFRENDKIIINSKEFKIVYDSGTCLYVKDYNIID